MPKEQDWSMAIQHISTIDGTTITTLQGRMVDQAALFGVLNSLYGLGFPIVSVQCQSGEVGCE